MKLSFEQIQNITYGVDRCEKTESGIIFHRFSKEQEDLYKTEAPELYLKVFATAGVSLRFITDSATLNLSVYVNIGSTRTYFSHDVFVDSKYIDSIRNFNDDILNESYTTNKYPLGLFNKSIYLGPGEKEVTVLFPALVSSSLVSIEIDDNSNIKPIPHKDLYLAIGDSISQGYDSSFAKNRYTNKICEQLNLCEHNLAIGAEKFRPSLATTINTDKYSLITVAYGSNDWNGLPFNVAQNNAEMFLKTLSENSTKDIFVLSPIWRADYHEKKPFGDFEIMGKVLEDICNKYTNLKYIDGFKFVPENTRLFGDHMLHPNDFGFDYYAQSLLAKLN